MQRKPMIWTGRIISGVASFPFIFGTLATFFPAIPSPTHQEMFHMGMPPHIEAILAVLSILCLVTYWIPATAILGAILFTGYMGGAILAHLRVGDPLVLQIVTPILLWLGLWLRDSRLRSLIPLRKIAPAV